MPSTTPANHSPALLWLLSEAGIPMSGEESSDFDAWVKRQASDPYAAHEDPVAAFRLEKLGQFSPPAIVTAA